MKQTIEQVNTSNISNGSVTPRKMSDRFGGIGRFTEFFPEKRVIYSPDTPGTVLATGTNLTVTYDTSVFRSGRSSLKVVVAAGSTTQNWLQIALPASVRVKGHIAYVVRSPDWTMFAEGTDTTGGGLNFRFFESADCTGGFHDISPVYFSTPNVISGYGITSTPWAANEWRPIHTVAPQYAANSTPTGWGDSDAHDGKDIASITIYFKTGNGNEATIYIDEIYGEVWPKPFLGLMLDGGYTGALTALYGPFAERGWPGAIRVYRPGTGGTNPTWAQLQAIAQTGLWTIGPHLRKDTADTTFTNAHTEEEVVIGITQILQSINANLGQDYGQCGGARSATFLGNYGRYDTAEMATRLRRAGILCARCGCADLAGFGIDPFTSDNAKYSDGTITGQLSAVDGYIPVRGQYNYALWSRAGYAGLALSTHTSEQRNDFSYYWEGRFDVARRLNLAMLPYAHNVIASPGTSDIGPDFASGMIAYLDAHASEYAFGTISDLYSMTYGRPGDIYVNTYGDWKNRTDSAWVF